MAEKRRGVASDFVTELERLLAQRQMSWRKLAEAAGYHPSWLSKVRNGRPPSAGLVRRCDEVLGANGRLIALAAETQMVPAHLPAAPAGFVGRDKEVGALVAALSGDRVLCAPAIVAIDGLAGAGKTAAALRGAHQVATCGEYQDGELYADLRGYARNSAPAEPTDVLEEFLVALGVPADEVPIGLEHRVKLYRSLLAGRHMLVLLDNVASSDQVEPLLPGSVTCGVIVTSRRRLAGLAMRPGVERVTIGPMTIQESIALLQRALGVRAKDAAAELPGLARLCGNLPLALLIAAERIVGHPYRPVSELVAELSEERQRLDGLSTDDSVAIRTVARKRGFNDLPHRP